MRAEQPSTVAVLIRLAGLLAFVVGAAAYLQLTYGPESPLMLVAALAGAAVLGRMARGLYQGGRFGLFGITVSSDDDPPLGFYLSVIVLGGGALLLLALGLLTGARMLF